MHALAETCNEMQNNDVVLYAIRHEGLGDYEPLF